MTMTDEIDVDNPCNSCPLDCRPITPNIPDEARFLVVTNRVDRMKIQQGRFFGPESGGVFKRNFGDAGFSIKDFGFTASVLCNYNPELFRTKDKRLIEKCCALHLNRLIEWMQPEVIIPMGAEAAKAVEGRAVKISKVRGVVSYNDLHGTFVMPTFDAQQVATYPQHEPLFASDCRTLRRLLDNDFDVSKAERDVGGDYQLIDDLQFLIDMEPERLTFDIEASGLRWYEPGAKIYTMQFCVEPGKAYMLPWDHPESTTFDDERAVNAGRRRVIRTGTPSTNPNKNPTGKRAKLIRQLQTLLQNPKTRVGNHNLKFDALWLYGHFGFRFRIDTDTLSLATELDENLQNKDQDTLVKLYVPEMAGYADGFNSRYDKSRMDLVPMDDLLPYGCGDVDSAFRLWDVLEPRLYEDPKAWARYRRVVMPGYNSFITMEREGNLVDEEALDEFQQVMTEYVDELNSKLLKQIPNSIKRKHLADAKKGTNPISLRRKEFLLDVLFYHPDGFKLKPVVFTKTTAKLQEDFKVPSTSAKDHLPYFFDECPFAMELAHWVKMDRLLSTNIISFRNKYVTDGRIHPIYTLDKAVTGRTASRDPNGQNFPNRGKQAKAYKKIFIPPEGKIMLQGDLSQAELRIAADMSRDRLMCKIYQEDGDIHVYTACIVMGVTLDAFLKLPKEEQDLARFKAKAVNFGFLYGMGWRKFIGYAKTQYGVVFTEREAQRIRQGFFHQYASLPHWHDRMRQFASQHLFVRSYSGKIRHLPMIESHDEGVQAEAGRQSINSPVQNFGSDLGVMALSRIDQEIDHQYLDACGFVHDAVYATTSPQYVEWGAKTLKHYMESNPILEWFGIDMVVPIKADVSFGWNMSEQNEMKGLVLDKRFDFRALESKNETKFGLPRQVVPPNNGRVLTRPYPEIEIEVY
jgi:uracil-DNA glycosylase family 4